MELAAKPIVEERASSSASHLRQRRQRPRHDAQTTSSITTRDESAYARNAYASAIFEHGKVERVMIVGGGDLSIADEALKHKGVKEVVLVDIDGRVIELCREHFAQINAKAFKDRRLKIEVADAFEYLGRPKSKGPFRPHHRRPAPIRSVPARRCSARRSTSRVRKCAEAGRLRGRSRPACRSTSPGRSPRRWRSWRNLPAIGPLSDRGAELYRRLHGAELGRQQEARNAPPASARRRRRIRSHASRRTITIRTIHAASFALPEWIRRLVP